MKLHKYMAFYRITQKDIAEAIGVTTQYVGLLQNGKRNPSIKIACKIEKFTNGEVPITEWKVE